MNFVNIRIKIWRLWLDNEVNIEGYDIMSDEKGLGFNVRNDFTSDINFCHRS